MGIYGYKKNTTPFLDSLFKKGILFDNAISPAILTFQTDAAIFSGLYPSQNNVMTWDTPIKKDLYLLPKVLGLYDYKSAAFVSPSLWEDFGFNKQFDMYFASRSIKNIKESKVEVANWMKKVNKPFFAFWHVYDVHLPFLVPPDNFCSISNSVFKDDNNKWNWVWEGQSISSIESKHNEGERHKFKEEDIEYLKCAYDYGISYVDNQLKEFIESIEKEDFFKNTLIIVSSEHGEDLDEHGFIFHRDLYDVNIRLPLAFIHPELNHKRIQDTVSLLDIFPTITDLIGIDTPQNIEGISLLSNITDQKTNRFIFTERAPYEEYSVRTNNWKYILRNPLKRTGEFVKEMEKIDSFGFAGRILKEDIDNGDELYDLENDPLEQNNLIGNNLEIETILKKEVLSFSEKMKNAREQNKADREIKKPEWIFSYP